MTPLFFDADRDGDLDLFVVSGGVECEPGDRVLRDRLYLNDGKGGFRKAKAPGGVLPEAAISGGAACAADLDRDGDLDLFVGGRSIPGRYPETPRSQLLRNDSKPGVPKFTEVASPALAATGLVTAALWADFDGDEWTDLLVAHEWGPVKLYRNEEGTLRGPEEASGLQGATGWWSSLAAADLDGDGDLDFAAGNTGLNTKYHATADHPALIYYGDFDGSGKKRIVEAKFEGVTVFPVRGFSCSSDAIPSLKQKHASFHSFASRALPELYAASRLTAARRFEANTLESGLFVNDGKGRFSFRPLPRLAQAAPIFGAAFTDLDRDGDPDLCVVGNSHSPQPETGHMDGGVGLILRNDGKGNFEPIPPSRSGFVVPGDAKALQVTDLNRDGWPDMVVGINNGEVQGFLNLGGPRSSR
ncbi:MAG: VCBS repeat-containing protein [Akkermansiaceae bacterium]|nr:VCBS repeat-containing protein [Akkermansiaceae bacterium]